MSWRGPFSAIKALVRKQRRQVERALSLDVSKYQGLSMPPGYLRSCGHAFRDDAHFVKTAGEEALRLVNDLGLQKTTEILDIGCGAGRLPIGFFANDIEVKRYAGVDISKDATDWCSRHITKSAPHFTFHVTDAQHRKYNPDGTPVDEAFSLPYEDQSFDLIYLGGVFAIMEPNDIFIYCKEIVRLLRKDGKVFLTAFIEEDVPAFEENPENYKVANLGPLTIARYSKENFYSIVESAGLAVEAFEHGVSIDDQSVVHLRHA